MTDGPYDESIRGPGNRGIGGLWTLLNTIAGGLGSLPQLAADVAAIRAILETPAPVTPNLLSTLLARISFLTGTATPNATFGTDGFPGYMRFVVGNRLTATGNDQDLLRLSIAQRSSLLTVLSALSGSPSGLPGEQNVLAAISTVLGDINGAPVGSTIKDLLRSIDINALRSADCCEDGGTGEPFPAPTTACGTGPTTWTECSLELRFSEVEGNDVYAVVFPPSITSVEAFEAEGLVSVQETFDPGLQTVSDATENALSLDACIAWNFGTSGILVDYSVGTVLLNNPSPFNSYTSTTEPPDQVGAQLVQWTARTSTGVRRALQANFGFPNGTAVTGKVWVGLPTP